MPTYEYVCDSCGHDFEVFQRMSDEPVSACPECGKPVRRVISGGLGINFRGSGFYVSTRILWEKHLQGINLSFFAKIAGKR